MIETGSGVNKESVKDSQPCDKREGVEYKESAGATSDNKSNDDLSSLERSYEVVSPVCVSRKSNMASSDDNEADRDHDREVDQITSSGHAGEKKTRSNSENGARNSLQGIFKKSSSGLLSKISSTNTENESSSNLPSSLANAFSSFSSFTSNFNISSSANDSTNPGNLTIETASTSTKLSLISETKEDIFNKKAALERRNLINLTKLIVKDLISSSLAAGRTIDECHNTIHLKNYFTLVDRILKHGLKQNLLSNRSASLWNALDNLSKYLRESTLMSESIRSLAHTKTPDGKIKAWIRLAMMQKRLPEYFNGLLANKQALLKDAYHDFAFMLNDEAHVFAGLIIGVNVIDCNFFVKDANFDIIDEIIDLSPYLRAASQFDEDGDMGMLQDGSVSKESGQTDEARDLRNLTKVLDQKNYLEERNKRLESTICDLQSKLKNCEEQNSKLEMEVKVSEVRIQKMLGKRDDIPPSDRLLDDTIKQGGLLNESPNNHSKSLTTEEIVACATGSLSSDGANTGSANGMLSGEPETGATNDNCSSTSLDGGYSAKENHQHKEKLQDQKKEITKGPCHSNDTNDCRLVELEKKYADKLTIQEKELIGLRERASILETSYRGALEKIKVLERDLDVQTSMSADKETTIKIYEKDIRDKQNQVESLRASLTDAKKLNFDLSDRLNETSDKLKDRVNTVSNLQVSLDKWKLENKTLAARLQDKQTALVSLKKDLDASLKTIEELKRYNEKINDELRRERECGQSSSVTVETQNAKIAQLTEKLQIIEQDLNETRPYRQQAELMAKRCLEYEQSLEEVGLQLRESRLEVESLKENSSVFLDSQWMDSKQVKNCALCQQLFSVTRRKHHCRLCGNVFCQTCSDNKMELASSSKPARVCDTCHSFLLAKFVKSSSSSTA